MKTTRRCVYPKDVQRITGRSGRTGSRLLQQIRISLGKQPHQYVTDEEFAHYTGIPIEVVRANLLG
jgi:hypothetical protein